MATIQSVAVENFLSLEKLDIKLLPLNVLVGPNGAGKTNILKIFQFLGDVARLDLIPALDAVGGFSNLLYRGESRKNGRVRIEFTGVISDHASDAAPDKYTLSFWEVGGLRWQDDAKRRAFRRHETIAIKRTAGRGRRITLAGGSVKVENIQKDRPNAQRASLSVQQAATGLATLRKLGEAYEAAGVEALARVFEDLRLFEIDVDRIRRPHRSVVTRALRPDASNLAAYLEYLSEDYPDVFDRISDDVRFVLPGFRGFQFNRIGGSDEFLRLDIREDGLNGSTPLARVSFGTVRSIALFAMLNDPNPPQLTCLEEIDHGLHPHALDRVVDRLRDASKKTQIILATHSPALVNRLSPNELIIVERAENGATRADRPDPRLIRNLQNRTGYELGELWFSGTIGGSL